MKEIVRKLKLCVKIPHSVRLLAILGTENKNSILEITLENYKSKDYFFPEVRITKSIQVVRTKPFQYYSTGITDQQAANELDYR